MLCVSNVVAHLVSHCFLSFRRTWFVCQAEVILGKSNFSLHVLNPVSFIQWTVVCEFMGLNLIYKYYSTSYVARVDDIEVV